MPSARDPEPAGATERDHGGFGDHVQYVFLQLLPLFRTKDFREGMISFLEKRKPRFEGQ